MSDPTPRLRMFAGPNGSGKTTVKQSLGKSDEWFGLYINPDELELEARETGFISLRRFPFSVSGDEFRSFFESSALIRRMSLLDAVRQIQYQDDCICFGAIQVNAYLASVVADFLRRRALAQVLSFTCETVMSSEDKVALLRDAQAKRFRTYLYYIATGDPEINVRRVQNRVANGGHNVPTDKIVSRYFRSLELLPHAVRHSNRAFLFDTSGGESWYFAEITDGAHIRYSSDEMPNWFAPHASQFSVEQ